VRDSIMMTNSLIGYHSVVDQCILYKGVNVGELCYIGFGSSLARGNCDITVVGTDVIIPSHTVIGRGCKVLPGITTMEFPGHAIPPGSIIPEYLSR